MNRYGEFAGLGVGLVILMIVLYVGFLALLIWVGYLIQRTAVKNGMLRAMQESGMTFAPRPGPPYPGGGYPGGQPPHPGQPPAPPQGPGNPPPSTD
ncbi:hypothetical protein [Microbacterium oleivorans]|uniref:hypothetical protein n=1 Tax=Microbacterium TaxID=33882 RepID=UPI00203F7CD0|nr:hypothetical protein [Microbacterium oleivorans]MCM3697694.1 hypothetical protein [Microbacterium oleivorans]